MQQTMSAERADYPFTTRYLAVDGQRMHYVDEGAGEPILFVHGTPTWSYDWRHVIGALRASHRCIAPDLLGFGLSDRPRDAAYTPEAHAKRLARFVDQLGLDRFSLVVHDFGGPIGLPLLLDRPERVRKLVLINTWMWSLADDRNMAAKARLAGSALGRFLYRRLNLSLRVITPSAYGDRRKLTPAIHKQYLDRFPDAWSREAVLWALAKALLGSSAFYDSLWQRRAALAAVPTLILWGMKDTAFEPYLLDRWRTALPQAKVVQLAESGHWPHEEEPARVTRELQQFMG
jgi:haloalkane dehalogenase